MKYISEERLTQLLGEAYAEYEELFIYNLLNNECTELNPWQPIDTAPENRLVRLFVKSSPLVSSYQTDGVITDSNRHQYSHWHELSEDPPCRY